MKLLRTFLVAGLLGATLFAQGKLDPAKLQQPPTDSWPTYHGDYSGRRFSTLTKINTTNINSLSLAWVFRTSVNEGAIKSTPLVVNGVMYFTLPDHVWAIDARTGREIWHHAWQSIGGNHLGNRGVGVYRDLLFFETPDCHLVALNLKDGKERWRKTIGELDQFYYGSVAPVVVKNHLIAGISGDDLDRSGYIQSHDPETGELQWRFYTVPQKKGDPGSETWPNEDAMRAGAAMTWQPITYDPELNLIYVTTGNPHPVIAHKNRAGANLFTECIIALNPDTGKMAWYFQVSPHDTHDWDANEVPVLIDGEFNGQRRKLLVQASRNGYFFVLDRATGKNLLTTEFVKTNWSKGIDAKGQPIPNPAKEPQLDGTLTSPNQSGATNWHPPSYNPITRLFYVAAARAYSVYYIFDPDDNPQGWGGTDRAGWSEMMLEAIDYQTGKIRWSHRWEGAGSRAGVLSTAGNLVFTDDGLNNLVALDARNGEPLWHVNLGAGVSNGPMTYELDGSQYLVLAAGDTLYGFVMRDRVKSEK